MASSSTFPSLAKPYHDMEWRLIRKNIGSFLVWLLLPSAILLLFVLYSSDTTTEEIPSQSPALNRSVTHSTTVQSPALVPGNNQSLIVQTMGSPHPPTGRHKYNQTSVTWPPLQSPNAGVHGHAEVCDLSTGKWVRDSRGSIYTNSTCPTLPSVDNCLRHGKDPGYIYWRWKPDACELPMFEPWTFLRMVRGKKMAFIGDSLARNQMESLLCLLSQAETPKDIYRDETDKFRTWYFPSHDFTLMVMWTQFFVEGTEKVINGSPAYYELHLDKINKNWTQKLPMLHYAIISGGNWFIRKIYLYEGGKPIGCVFCNEANLTNIGSSLAIRRTLRSALHSINGCQECEGLVTFLRTFSPAHFEHGSWFDGGYCNRTQPLEDGDDQSLHGRTWEIRNIQVEEMERIKGDGKGARRFELLDVTKAIMLRADAHRGSLWNKQSLNGSDCLHWCLPGPIDMWNDLLFASLKRITSIK